jgi:hypothetical protein
MSAITRGAGGSQPPQYSFFCGTYREKVVTHYCPHSKAAKTERSGILLAAFY